jgi:hypothetical protein
MKFGLGIMLRKLLVLLISLSRKLDYGLLKDLTVIFNTGDTDKLMQGYLMLLLS